MIAAAVVVAAVAAASVECRLPQLRSAASVGLVVEAVATAGFAVAELAVALQSLLELRLPPCCLGRSSLSPALLPMQCAVIVAFAVHGSLRNAARDHVGWVRSAHSTRNLS